MAQSRTSQFAEAKAEGTEMRSLRTCSRCKIQGTICDGSLPCARCQADNVRCKFSDVMETVTRSWAGTVQEPIPTDVAGDGSLHKLRYHVVLNAPTAMVRSQEETPVTYLNKGQAYHVSIADHTPSSLPPTAVRYRSCVRIVFDDEEQRYRPASRWQLWKEGRGLHEAHRRGGRLQAVEFVDNDATNNLSGKARMKLERVSHDGFTVIWYPTSAGQKVCSIYVRLNFLSTDFSHSKGVKGIPVRLCVKTEMQVPQSAIFGPEICYCKVKLFRDHGAERKMSNDVAHVKKSMEKIEKMIASAECSDNSHRPGKRKRDDHALSSTWSTPQDNTVTDTDTATRLHNFNQTLRGRTLRDAEDIETLETKLAALQGMFASTHPNSILNLKAEDEDDPDLYPVHLSQENSNEFGDLYQALSAGRGNKSPASLHSQNSRGSSPPRSSSIGTTGGRITPETIPFQAFQSNAFQDELYQPSATAFEQQEATAPTSPVNEYRYTKMEPGEVRLMVLHSGKFDDVVSCGLKVMPIHRLEGSQLVYQALSYAWGPKTNPKEIWIEDVQPSGEEIDTAFRGEPNASLKPRKFHVRPNLYAALRRLRSESEELWFWIDALCIDQENLVEKGHQIPRMLDIYCNAWSVCIWLGELEWPDRLIPNEPFDLIGTIINLKLLDYILEAPSIDEQMLMSLIAFARLLKRPWFRRRWVIQEVSSSTRASVQYGHKKVNWIDFADAIQLFMLKLDRIRALYRGSRLFDRDPEAFSHVEAAGASAIVQATNDVVRKGEGGKIVSRLCDIETLVMRFVYFDASDPRDTIFALWSLSNIRTTAHDHLPSLGRSLTVSPSSYMRPCESVYIDFVCHCIKMHGSLDTLCRHWALPVDQHPREARGLSLPTWISTTANSPFGMHLDSGGRMNGDSLVGAPGRKVYNASSDTSPAVEIVQDTGLDIMLRVTGRVISRVSQVSPRIVDGVIPYDAFRLLGWTDKSQVDTLPDRLWRTLVADRTNDGSIAPSWWRRASMFALSMASRDGDLSTQRLLQNKSLPETVHEYLRRVQAMVWNRKIFALESTSFIPTDSNPSPEMVGLGPRDVRQGDYVCVLKGCSVLVVLREVPRRGHATFEFVGECYMHGMMDGEALDTDPSSLSAWLSMMDFDLV